MAIKIVTTEEMQGIEKAADAGGLSFEQMMENAGMRVAEAIDVWAGVDAARVLVLVGPGNNGGDGLVVARHLLDLGATAHIYVWKRETEGDKNWDLAAEAGIPVTHMADDRRLRILRQLLEEVEIVVDSLLGTGMVRPIKGDLKKLLSITGEVIAERRRPGEVDLCMPAEGWVDVVRPMVVAVDVPTGLNSDTGALDPATLPADLTVALAAVKRGHILSPGAAAVGRLVIGDIGVPDDLYADVKPEMATPARVAGLLPQRPTDANKGTFGRALVVAGSVNYTGAAYLAATSAIRVGTGLVTLALPQAIHLAVASRLAEATYLLLPHDMGVLAPGAAKVLSERVEGYHALLIGPGLGQEKPTGEFLDLWLGGQEASSQRRVGFLHSDGEREEEGADATLPPLVVDADGLNLLAKVNNWWQRLPARTILTPHPGEMARLMGCETQKVVADRLGCAVETAAKWGHVVVLKGAYTLVADPDGRVVALPFANPALATAGSGDVLAGAIVGMLAQGLAPFDAALVGAYLHGLAGELAGDEIGKVGVAAGDLPTLLPTAIRRLSGMD